MPTPLFVLGLALGAIMPQAPPSPLDIGPGVGAAIPRFEARDQAGRLRTFDDLKGPSGLMLVFVRSADW